MTIEVHRRHHSLEGSGAAVRRGPTAESGQCPQQIDLAITIQRAMLVLGEYRGQVPCCFSCPLLLELMCVVISKEGNDRQPFGS